MVALAGVTAPAPDLPPFAGTFVVGSWAEGRSELIETTWEVTYRSSSDWSVVAVATTSATTPLIRSELRDGVLSDGVVERGSRDFVGEPSRRPADGPSQPFSWLRPYVIDRLAASPSWEVSRGIEPGSHALVESVDLDCRPTGQGKAEDSPSIFTCREGAETIHEETSIELDPSGIPRSVSVRYDGVMVGSVVSSQVVPL